MVLADTCVSGSAECPRVFMMLSCICAFLSVCACIHVSLRLASCGFCKCIGLFAVADSANSVLCPCSTHVFLLMHGVLTTSITCAISVSKAQSLLNVVVLLHGQRVTRRAVCWQLCTGDKAYDKLLSQAACHSVCLTGKPLAYQLHPSCIPAFM